MLMAAQREPRILGQYVGASCGSFGQLIDSVGFLRCCQRAPPRVTPGYGRDLGEQEPVS